MIPAAHIIDWRRKAPWSNDAQVEQDLVVSRALVELFADEELSRLIAFRGGTALYKLIFDPPARYSEDIDLVQVSSGNRKTLMKLVPKVLEPWLGKSTYKQSAERLTYLFRFESEIEPKIPLRLKVEINTNETFAVLGYIKHPFGIDSPWYSGTADVVSFTVEELLATKLRALYQRRKGRDLFDLSQALEQHPQLDSSKIVECFTMYLSRTGITISRAQFEQHMHRLMSDKKFIHDIIPLLVDSTAFEPHAAYKRVHEALITRLKGEPWKGLSDE